MRPASRLPRHCAARVGLRFLHASPAGRDLEHSAHLAFALADALIELGSLGARRVEQLGSLFHTTLLVEARLTLAHLLNSLVAIRR